MGIRYYLNDAVQVAIVQGTSGYGDDGKGKVTGRIAEHFDIIARVSGGPNTGASIYLDNLGKRVLHLCPVTIYVPKKMNVVTGRVVVNPEVMAEEVKEAKEAGLGNKDLLIGENLPVILPYHIAEDKLADADVGKINTIGTTGRGVGPAIKDFVDRRSSIVVSDLFNKTKLEEKIAATLVLRQKVIDAMGLLQHNRLETIGACGLERFVDSSGCFDPKKIADEWHMFALGFLNYVGNADEYLALAYAKGMRILIEGTQGFLLDVTHGVRPYVTSSSVTANGLLDASGLSNLDYTVCVVKALPTKVGGGPLPTEIFGEEAARLRELGGEYGATTGRPRRLYYPDLLALRYIMQKTPKPAGIVLTKLDILKGEKIRAYDSYKTKQGTPSLDNKYLHSFVPNAGILGCLEGDHYVEFGPFEDISKMSNAEELEGTEALRYVEYLQKWLDVPVIMIGNGPKFKEVIEL